MEIFIAGIAAICCFYGFYRLAFWLIVIAIFYVLVVLAKSVSSRSWYSQRRVKAGLKDSSGIGALLLTKFAILVALNFGAIRLAELSNYDIRVQLRSLCSQGTHAVAKSCAAWIGNSEKWP